MSLPLTLVVVGASGHLARTKIIPALFALYCQGHLPKRLRILGFARSNMTTASFRESIDEYLACRYTPGESCENYRQDFLSLCDYVAGEYSSADAFKEVGKLAGSADDPSNLLFYLAIPPQVFDDVVLAIGEAGLARRGQQSPWTRVVIEKPFGRDRASSDALTAELSQVIDEAQTFRIDHYLGKEVIQNLFILRFANLIFEPIWNRHYVQSVEITWKEDTTIEGRGGYFDSAGIIRDVMQNHLVQILSLIAMEPPPLLDATHIRNAKVNALLCVPPLTRDQLVIGQYTGVEKRIGRVPGYREDPSVPDDTRTPTYAAAVLRVENPRWDGVPFLMRAGKGLDGRMTEIRIRFREIPGSMFRNTPYQPSANELVIRVQPDEAIYFEITNKVPGLGMDLQTRLLDLRYDSAFSELIPDAYEDLLLDVVNGEKTLFIRGDELAAAWDIFTPVLAELEQTNAEPESYPFGSAGPAAADELVARMGLAWRCGDTGAAS